MPAQEQAEQLARLRSGDDASYAELIRTHGPALLRLTRRLMRSEEDARDCFQEALLTVARRIGGFEGKSSLSTWMYRITANVCLMKLRKASTKSEAFIDDLMPTFDEHRCRRGERLDAVPTADALLEQAQTRRTVRQAIDQLPDGYRAVLILRDIEERRAAEVAQLLGISPGLVNVRLHRARAALKKLLEPALFGGSVAADRDYPVEVTS